MRITAGIHGGRTLHTPKNKSIRPTSDKVRAAIFNALQARGAIEGSIALDLFCGTGAMGIEALSRGAETCTFIDKNRESIELAKTNIRSLNEEQRSTFFVQDATKLKPKPKNVHTYNLVFIDPPYNENLIESSIKRLIEGYWLEPGAILVIESEKQLQLDNIHIFEILSEKIYGDTKVTLLKTSLKTPE